MKYLVLLFFLLMMNPGVCDLFFLDRFHLTLLSRGVDLDYELDYKGNLSKRQLGDSSILGNAGTWKITDGEHVYYLRVSQEADEVTKAKEGWVKVSAAPDAWVLMMNERGAVLVKDKVFRSRVEARVFLEEVSKAYQQATE